MQIREKGKKLLCIRTVYVPEKKRTVGVTVASQESYLSTVSEKVSQQLTKEEVDQLTEWLAKRAENDTVNRLKFSLSYVAPRMGEAAEALTVNGLKEGLSEQQAAEIWQAHERLAKALRKAGFKKPKGQTAKKAVDNHPDLPFDEQN